MRSASILFVLSWALAACQTLPPAVLSRSLVATPELTTRQPRDIAVLPIQDATAGRVLTANLEHLRDEIARALARQAYSPLSAGHVDARIGREASSKGSAVDASHVRGLAPKCESDAVLGIRFSDWDESTLMDDARARFGAEVLMLATDGTVLWSGRVEGSVKAGGEGPAPLTRAARSRAAVDVFARALIDELPPRRPAAR